MRALLGRIASLSLPLGWVFACSSSTSPPSVAAEPDAAVDASEAGVDATLDASDASPQCELSRKFGSALCEKCLRARCCTPIVACESDAACKTLLDCAVECVFNSDNPATCIERCEQTTPAGKDKYRAFDSCIAAPSDGPSPGCAFDCSQ